MIKNNVEYADIVMVNDDQNVIIQQQNIQAL